MSLTGTATRQTYSEKFEAAPNTNHTNPFSSDWNGETMNRLIVILLCVCGVVVCAFLAYLGYQQDLTAKQTAKESPPPFTCKSLIDRIPNNIYSFTITDFQPGKHFVQQDQDDDEKWERVLVPIFPSDQKKLGRNYKSLILVFADTPDKNSLFEKVQSDTIEADYWVTSQKLDSYFYNRLAEKYSSMDFSRSKIMYCGFPKSTKSFGMMLFWGSSIGGILSVLVLGWQSLNLVIAGVRSEANNEFDDDDEDVITNRAGLPTKSDKEQYLL